MSDSVSGTGAAAESAVKPSKPTGISSLAEPVYRIIEPVTQWLIRRRVHPNTITVMGFALTVAAAFMYSRDHVREAGLLLLLGALCDVFDGRVARVSGLASKFGSFFDSTLDRISEIAMYIGLMTLYNAYQLEFIDIWMIYVIALALGGSLMVSYTRAKAESLGFDCYVGLMQRGERILLLGLGSLFFGLAWDGVVLTAIIVIVAVLTNATAVQRMFWVYKRGKGVPLDGGGGASGKA